MSGALPRTRLALRGLAVLALLAAAGAAAAGGLRPFDAGSFTAIRAAQAGKPFVLAFWSASCAPCREELAHWGAWRRAHPGVGFVLVATDPAPDHPQAEALLAGHDMKGIETWGFADDYAEPLRWSVDKAWRGELPRAYFFDAAHRAEARSGRLDETWVRAWLARQARGAGARP